MRHVGGMTKGYAGWRPLLAAEAKRSPSRLVGRAGAAGWGGVCASAAAHWVSGLVV